MKKITKNIIKISIGIIILFIFIKSIGINNIWQVFKKVKPLWLIPWILVYIPVQIFAAFNYKLLLKAIEKNVSLIYLFKTQTLSHSLGQVSPGRLGEFSMIFFLRKKGITYGEGLALTILDKIITFFIFVCLTLISLIWFFNIKLFLTILVICSIVLGAGLFFIYSEKIRTLIKKYILRKHSKHFTGFSKTFKYILKKKKKYLLLNTMNTMIKWTMSFIGFWFLFMAFGEKIPFYFILFVSAMVKIISLIPISFSGLGINEASSTYLYYILAGIDTSVTANVMIMELIKTYLIAFIIYSIFTNLIYFKLTKQ